MCEDNPLFMFVTLFFGVFDPVDGSLTYANAGHPAPFLYRSDGSSVALEPTADAVLGIMEDEDYAVSPGSVPSSIRVRSQAFFVGLSGLVVTRPVAPTASLCELLR